MMRDMGRKEGDADDGNEDEMHFLNQKEVKEREDNEFMRSSINFHKRMNL
jgi:hypothetical protein